MNLAQVSLSSYILDSEKRYSISDISRKHQRDKIEEMLELKECTCSDFMKAGIAQYNARIYELRRLGFNIHYNKKTGFFKHIK